MSPIVPPPPWLEELLRELHVGLERLYGPRLRGIMLFGSRATDRATDGSDIDIALILDQFLAAGDEIGRCSGLVAALSLKHGCVVSVIPIRERDWLTRQTPLLMNIRREGVPV